MAIGAFPNGNIARVGVGQCYLYDLTGDKGPIPIAHVCVLQDCFGRVEGDVRPESRDGVLRLRGFVVLSRSRPVGISL
jgi:hypothetical protein